VSDQLLLVDVPAVPNMTARQQAVYDAIERAGYDGLFTEELGALEHARLGRHAPDETCRFCGQSGGAIAKELRAKGLTTQRRKPTRWTVAGKLAGAPAKTKASDVGSAYNRDGIPF